MVISAGKMGTNVVFSLIHFVTIARINQHHLDLPMWDQSTGAQFQDEQHESFFYQYYQLYEMSVGEQHFDCFSIHINKTIIFIQQVLVFREPLGSYNCLLYIIIVIITTTSTIPVCGWRLRSHGHGAAIANLAVNCPQLRN